MNIRLIILLPFLVGYNACQKPEDTSAKSAGKLPSDFDKTRDKPPAYFPKEIPASCVEDPMPAFDEIIKILSDENGKPSKDTIVERIPKRRTIFKPCREYIFKATFLDFKGKLISENQIKMVVSGRRWEFQPEMQDEVIIEYEYKQEDITKINEYHINKVMAHQGWEKSITTGIIENAEQVWMHPFRDNQYIFTEVAPYPDVKLPLSVGKTWTWELNIYRGWGEWNNSTGNFIYLVESNEDIQTPFGKSMIAGKSYQKPLSPSENLPWIFGSMSNWGL